MADAEFLRAYEALVRAQRPEEVFGKLAGSSRDEQAAALKSTFRMLLKLVHPDRHAADPREKYMADECMKALNEIYASAEKRVQNGAYGKTPAPSSAPVDIAATFTHGRREYTIFKEAIEGDFCTVHFGQRRDTTRTALEEIVLKVARDSRDNKLLEREAAVLKAIQHKSMPVYLESLTLETGQHANVLRRVENCYDLHTVRERFPHGLLQEHAAWVLDRLLSVLGYLHSNTTIHGSIEPGNILITPHNHNGLLIDYTLAVPDATKADAAYLGTNEYSAPELSAHARPHPAADIYSLGRSMVYLLGGAGTDVPSHVDARLARFLNGFMHPDPARRESDAWRAWHELRGLRTEIFGAPNQFLPLVMTGGT